MRRRILTIIPLMLLIGSCVTTPLTPKQRVIWAANVYNAQYDLYLEQVLSEEIPYELRKSLKENPSLISQEMVRTDLTEDQKDVLRVKKQILTELHPLLLMAASYADQGMVPPEELESNIIRLVNKLVSAIED